MSFCFARTEMIRRSIASTLIVLFFAYAAYLIFFKDGKPVALGDIVQNF